MLSTELASLLFEEGVVEARLLLQKFVNEAHLLKLLAHQNEKNIRTLEELLDTLYQDAMDGVTENHAKMSRLKPIVQDFADNQAKSKVSMICCRRRIAALTGLLQKLMVIISSTRLALPLVEMAVCSVVETRTWDENDQAVDYLATQKHQCLLADPGIFSVDSFPWRQVQVAVFLGGTLTKAPVYLQDLIAEGTIKGYSVTGGPLDRM